MSEHEHTSAKQEHGTIKSYIVGFILSLVFTLIPYYLVVNQTVKGNVLLVTILMFAFLQMLIQIAFFLHWGRGPKPNWNLFFFVCTIGIISVVMIGSIVIINNLQYNMLPSEQTQKIINDEGIYQINGELTGACQEIGENHQIIIENGLVTPLYTYANECDTLTFINEDEIKRKIIFGSYPDIQPYAGENNLSVEQGHNETITLSETGAFQFYDQQRPETTGGFVISPEEE